MSAVKSYRRTSSKRKKAQRTSLQVLSVRRLTSFVVVMGLCVFAVWSYFHALTLVSEVSQSVEIAFAHIGFKLQDVIVEGRIRTDNAEILKILELKRGQPLLSINLSKAKEKLEGISWVKAAGIERRFPDTLFIRITEKVPIALWQNQAKTYLIDCDGELVETKEAYKYKELLLVTGYEAPRYIGKLIALLEKFPEIKSRVTTATHLRSTRWDIRLDDKVDVRLPEEDTERALGYLLELEKHHHLMEREVITIDMRLPEQLILRLTPEEIQRKNDTGKDA
nr:POTRA domain, FtsQ-type [uncultured bacterium]